MSKRLVLILSLVLGIGLIASIACAEVQNIKVSGDLTALALSRYGFNLAKPEADASGIIAITRVRFDADLTDDVVVTIRLINERVWGSSDDNAESTEMGLDLAYVTLNEFLYSPLTLSVGRQEFVLGSGLIIADGNGYTGLPGTVGDLTLRKAFDAIIGVLDYSPLTVTLGYLKYNEGETAGVTTAANSGLGANGDDINTYVINAAYDFGDDSGTMGELYYVLADVGDDYAAALANLNDINNVGLRVTSTLLDSLGLSAEFAYQTMRRPTGEGSGHRSDSALLLGANYTFADAAWTPCLGIDFTRLSDNWNSMFEDIAPADIADVLFGNSNCQIIGITATAKPAEDVMLKLRYANIELVDGLAGLPGWANTADYSMDSSKKEIGNELDFLVMYDYTEDVQLGLSLGYLDAGKAFNNREDASQVIGSMKVTF